MDHETTTWATLVHASTLLYFSRCVVFCFLSNLVPSSTVALPLLASRVLSEVARRQLFIVEGLSARHLVAYTNFFFVYSKTRRKKVNNGSRNNHLGHTCSRVNPALFLKVCSLLFSFQPCTIFHCRLATSGKPSLVRSGKTAVVYCRGLVSKTFGCIRLLFV